MGKKVIKVPLTREGISDAIRELRDYQKWMEQKQKEFLDALAQEGLKVASIGFAKAEYDGTNDVECSIADIGTKKKAIVATGHKDPTTGTDVVLFIEFGTGILNPDDHPEGPQNGMVHGQYGYGRGNNIWGWTYEGDPGSHGQRIYTGWQAGRIHTFGNPANKALFHSKTELEERFAEIARRVFTR